MIRLLLVPSLLVWALLPATAVTAEEAAPPSEIQRMVDELMPYVAKTRGLAWKQGVPAEVLTRKELGVLLEKQLDRDVTPEEWARDTRILRRLGMLRPDEDLKALLTSMFQAGVEGLYDPETKRMYVIEGFRGDGAKPTIVHELLHALEDQHLDLDALEEPYRDHEPDRVFALRCLMEGAAEAIRRQYMDEHPEVARTYYAQQGGNDADQQRQLAMMQRVPGHMMISSLLHYRIGPNFVGEALGAKSLVHLAQLYADPPTTGEQCLHPQRWLGEKRDYPRKVVWAADLDTAAGKGWTRFHEHAVGELDLAVYLDHFLGGNQGRLDPRGLGEGFYVCAMASRAARGWDAGRTAYLEAPDGRLVVVDAFAFDSPAEAREGARFLAAALHRANGKQWKGAGWKGDAADPTQGRFYDFVGRHGSGRVMQRGQEVLILDGVTPAEFERLWPRVAATRFEQDARDFGDSLPDPFAGDAVVDRRRGLGLRLPASGWTAEESDGSSPYAFATARQGSVEIEFTVFGQEHAKAGLPTVGRMVLGRMWQAKHARGARVMGRDGLVHGLPAAPGTKAWIYLASDLARTYVITVRGRQADVERLRTEIAALLQGVEAGNAGLRSIPGY